MDGQTWRPNGHMFQLFVANARGRKCPEQCACRIYFSATLLCWTGYSNFPVRWTRRLSPWDTSRSFTLQRHYHRRGPRQFVPLWILFVVTTYRFCVLGVQNNNSVSPVSWHVNLPSKRCQTVHTFILTMVYLRTSNVYMSKFKLQFRITYSVYLLLF